MNEDKVVLYRQDSKGLIRSWSIASQCRVDGIMITRSAGVLGGTHTNAHDLIDEGKAGRTVKEQSNLFFNSHIKKKIDAGYVYDVEEARANKPTNALGLIKPMLAKRIDKIKKLEEVDFTGAIVQAKYDGHRCMITRIDGKIFAYSKNGMALTAIEEILEEADRVLLSNNVTLDGELYCHGESLQRIASWAKKRQENTKRLTFICYDYVRARDFGYRSRMDNLMAIERLYDDLKTIKIAKSIPCDDFSLEYLYELRDLAIDSGYEGLIVRLDGTGYEDGRRSSNLLKVKKTTDGEFLVKDMIESKDGWAILVCVANNGKTFRVSAPGSHSRKHYYYRNRADYIGKLITLEYANLTPDGIPFHPVAKCWREAE